jgi:hypothetical protein
MDIMDPVSLCSGCIGVVIIEALPTQSIYIWRFFSSHIVGLVLLVYHASVYDHSTNGPGTDQPSELINHPICIPAVTTRVNVCAT